MNDYITLLSEARDEARRLTKVTGRLVEAVAVTCDCDFSKSCYLCAASGTYYELRYGFCDHLVQDGDDLECAENDCAERERLDAIMKETERLDSPLARLAQPLKSCRDRAIEEMVAREDSEAA